MNIKEKKENPDKEKDFQKSLFEMNLLQNELSSLDQQMQFIEKYIQDLNSLKNSIEELKNVKENQDFFSPLSQDIMLQAKITNTKELLVNMGGKVLVKKTIDETKDIVEEKISKTLELKEQIIQQIETILSEMDRIESQIKKSKQNQENLCDDEECNCEHDH